MKTTFRRVSQLAALAFGLAALVQFAGLVSFSHVSTTALVGGCVVASMVALALGDYARKPAFRVRRTVGDGTEAGPTVNRPAGPGPDWTYTTRVK